MKKEKFDPVRKDAMDTHNLAEAEFWLSEWIGAIFYFLINLGKRPFKELSEEKYLKRNVLAGWILRMVMVFGGLYLGWAIIKNL